MALHPGTPALHAAAATRCTGFRRIDVPRYLQSAPVAGNLLKAGSSYQGTSATPGGKREPLKRMAKGTPEVSVALQILDRRWPFLNTRTKAP